VQPYNYTSTKTKVTKELGRSGEMRSEPQNIDTVDLKRIHHATTSVLLEWQTRARCFLWTASSEAYR